MLRVTIPDNDLLDLDTLRITHIKGATVELEYSLAAIAKWESKWHIPFLTSAERSLSKEQLGSFVACMALNEVEDERIFSVIPNDVMAQIAEYMNNPMTATTISKDPNRPTSKRLTVMTAEQFYHLMIKCGIPPDWEFRHMNQLVMLIRVCEETDNPRQMSKAEILKQNRELNRARLASRKKR